MAKAPHFYMIFNVENSIEAFELYHNAFNAKKIKDELENTHITMDVFGIDILLISPGKDTSNGCIHFETESDLRKAYDVLTKEGTDYSLETEWEWTPLAAFVTDKYGVKWMFCI